MKNSMQKLLEKTKTFCHVYCLKMSAIRMIYFSVQGTLRTERRPCLMGCAGLERLAVKETGGEDWTDVAGVSMANES